MASSETPNPADRIQKTFDDLDAEKTLIDACTLQWKSVSDQFATLSKTLADRSQALNSKIQVLQSKTEETIASLDLRETVIPDTESAAAASIESKKEAAIKDIEEAEPKAPTTKGEFLRQYYRRMDSSNLWRFMIAHRKDLGEGEGGGDMCGAKAQIFLQMVVAFGLSSKFEEEELSKLVLEHASRKEMTKLVVGLRLGEKMADIIDELVKSGKELEAVCFACESGLVEKFAPVPLLKNYLQNAKKKSQTILKNGNHSVTAVVSFTGSTKVGRLVMEASAKSNLKPVSLELGGKSPLIIFDDADTDMAVELACKAAFFNKGEICVAGSRVYVQEGIYSELVKRVAESAKKCVVGDPFDPNVHQGPQDDR